MSSEQDAVERLLEEWPEAHGYIQEQDGIEICFECSRQLGEGYPGCPICADWKRRQALEAQRSRLETCQQENGYLRDALISARTCYVEAANGRDAPAPQLYVFTEAVNVILDTTLGTKEYSGEQ